MKTLTYLEVYVEALKDYTLASSKMSKSPAGRRYLYWQRLKRTRQRQKHKFYKALTKRLQEQEEELEGLRKYKSLAITRTLARKK